ncbi:MAG: hypothetical protein RLZZ59_166 [Pseudomonadota bacterium]|jgi:F-type H+-transporting ATPase subunit delta
MHNTKIIQTYARAFFSKAQTADSKNNEATRAVLKDFAALSELIIRNIKLKRVLEAPIYDLQNKIELIDIIANKLQFHKLSRAFLELMLKGGVMNYIEEIYNGILHLSISSEGKTTARLISASKISEKELEECKLKLEKFFSKKFVIKHEIDPSILGGILIKFDSMMYDASVLGAINKMRNCIRA